MTVYAIDTYNETVENAFQEIFPDAIIDDILITINEIVYEIECVDVKGYIPEQIQLYTLLK